MSCECYPEGYPASLRKGCDGKATCWVRAEIQERMQPGGAERQMKAYREECCARAEQGERYDSGEARPVESVRYRLQRFGVPAQALFALDTEKETKPIKAARQWWTGDRKLCPALVMLGDVGQGKTTAAAAVALEWARHHRWNSQPTGANAQPFVWLDGPRLRTLGAWGEAAADLLASAAMAELTILDDAGWDGDARAKEAVASVLLERVDHKRSTVLTSNLKGDDFRARYGQALADRLRAYAVVVTGEGKSMRGAA